MPPPSFSLLLNPQTLILTAAALRRFSASSSAAGVSGGRVTSYLRRARLIDSLRVRLRSHDPAVPFPLPSDDPFAAAAVIRSAPSPDSALCLLSSNPSLSHPAIHRAAARRLPALTDGQDASPIDRLRSLTSAGDLPSSLQIWSSIRSAAARRHPCAESYNLIISLYAAKGLDSSAVATFAQMMDEGANPNSRTYTIIIGHLVRSGNLGSAVEVFDLLPAMRIRRTSKQFGLLGEALASAGSFDEVRRLIGEMRSDGVAPGPQMRSAIAKIREVGYINETEEYAKELSPDERIEYTTSNSATEDDEEEDDDRRERIRLKPWLDPLALARALDGWEPTEVSALEEAGFVWTPRLVCKLLRAFKKPETAWEFFCWVSYQPGGFTHDRHTVSRMIAILARKGHVELVDTLFSKVKSEGIQLPFSTVRLVVDFYGLSKKADAALKVFHEAGSICGSISNSNIMLLYSSLLRTFLKCQKGNEALRILEEMLLEGVRPDLQTFSGLMEYFAGVGSLKTVHKLFGMVRQCGLEPDGYMHQVLILAYCKHERAALALRVFEEMRASNLMPDRRTKALLVKSLWKEGKRREAASVEERCEGIEQPAASPGHAWTVSYTDFKRVYDVYSGCFTKTEKSVDPDV